MRYTRSSHLHRSILAGTLLCLATSTGLQAVTPMPKNLGNGLGNLVQQYEDSRKGIRNAETDSAAASASDMAIKDAGGRILVNIYLNGFKTFAEVRAAISLPDVETVAVTEKYRKGVIEVYAPVSAVIGLARTAGVSKVSLVPRPVMDVGATTSQGVVQHRVNLQTVADGTGVKVGVMSDSFDKTTSTANGYAIDQTTNDLPGPGNTAGNTTPVQVIDDRLTAATDEGRAMAQIVHDMAPKAKLAFATASAGDVLFSNNIRALASNTNGNCDVIVDDVIYLNEPFFTDGLLAQTVDEVAAAGISYFSSAGNRSSTEAYYQDFRPVPTNNSAFTGSNIKLNSIPPASRALIAGGLHDFNPSLQKVDVSQSIQITGNGTISFQWDEPFDPTPTILPPVLQSGTGTVTLDQDGNGTDPVDFPFNGTAGQQIAITADGDGTGTSIPDVTIALLNPAGQQIAFEDTGTVPDTLLTKLPVTGRYTIRIGGFDSNPAAPGGESVGGFTYKVQNAIIGSNVVTDFNLLFFDVNGNFLSSVNEDNVATSSPLELVALTGTQTVQMVIGRRNVPPVGSDSAKKLRYVWFTSGSPLEYFAYDFPASFGHNSAAGGNGVAAYPFYPPYVPESFTSPGRSTIFFDSNGVRLTTPQLRQRPNLAAMDGANTTFFVSDANQDTDTFPNFFGTSAAAPHAAAIAALVLDANGGTGSVTPDQMRTILQNNTFPHDLDPSFSQGISNSTDNLSLTLTAIGNGTNTATTDRNFFRVAFAGPGSLIEVALNPGGRLDQSGNTTETNSVTTGFTSTKGLVFDTNVATGQPFVLGDLVGLGQAAADFTTVMKFPAPAPAVAGQFLTLVITIPENRLNNGAGFGFGIDRDEADAFGPNGAAGGNSADVLGASVLIPQGTLAPGGMAFSGYSKSGKLFLATFANQIGRGYSTLDGFGFINAEAAVNAPLP